MKMCLFYNEFMSCKYLKRAVLSIYVALILLLKYFLKLCTSGLLYNSIKND